MARVRGFGVVSEHQRREADAFFADLMGPRRVAVQHHAAGRREADAFFADLMGWRPTAGSRGIPQAPGAPRAWREDGQEDVGPPSAAPGVRRWNDPNISQKRKKVLAIIGNLFPMLWQEVGKPKVAVEPKHGGGQYTNVGPWSGPGTSCTSVNAMVGGYASPSTATKWAFTAPQHRAWVPWGHPTKKMPNVGDVYLLYRDNPEQGLRHCGFVLQVPTKPGELWVMGDGGQKAYEKQAAHVLVRSWELRAAGPSDPRRQSEWQRLVSAHSFAKPIDGLDYSYLAGGVESTGSANANRLIGWLDVDELPFPNEDFDPPQPSKRRGVKFTQADYEDLGATIDRVLQFYNQS